MAAKKMDACMTTTEVWSGIKMLIDFCMETVVMGEQKKSYQSSRRE
jgi:hypothetical protein